jgi:DNA-binding NarL/FixJ family response regulator/signal transduction histidine kinase
MKIQNPKSPEGIGGRFALPEAVGTPLSKEELASVVHESCRVMAAQLRFARMVALSFAPRERALRVVTTVGFTVENMRDIHAPVEDCPPVHEALRRGEIQIAPEAKGALPAPLVRFFDGPVAIVPLLIQERRIAALCGQALPGVSFHSAAWREEAERIAEKAALVAECERLQAAYQDVLRQQARTRAVAVAILEQQELSRVLHLITQHLVERFEIDRIALFLHDETGNRPAHWQNISAEYVQAAARITPLGPDIRAARASLLPFVVHDVEQRPEFTPLKELLTREGIHTIAVAPLQYGQIVQGAICLYPRDRRGFTPLEMSALKMMADQASVAIAVSRLFEQQREAAALRERNRLAREIHDTLAQALTGIVLQLEAVESLMEQPDLHEDLRPARQAAREALAETRALARHALEETRRSVMGLTATPLERLSLPEALQQELESFGQQARLRTAFMTSGEERPLSEEQKTALFRIAQEAMHNIRKHAKAERVRVALRYEEREARLSVEDDGVGFDVSVLRAPGAAGGYGLYGMQERARLLGGEARVESAEGWGTRVFVRLPYVQEEETGRRGDAETRGRGDTEAQSPEHLNTRTPEHPIKVLIADDHAVARQGLRAMLESAGDIVMVGEAADGVEALKQVKALCPDVLLLDVQMPRMNGLQTLQKLQAEQSSLPVIIITTFDTDEMLLQCIRAGAKGYLLKDAASADLVAAVRAAHRGESLLQPAMTAKLLGRLREDKTARARSAELNEREREILELLVTGARNKEIAGKLFITEKTVEFHLSNLFSKLGVGNRTEAARYALEHGLVTPDMSPS